MTQSLREDTSTIISFGPVVEDDGVTAYTATITAAEIFFRKAGGSSLIAKNSGNATHMASGIHQCTVDATDTSTIGLLEMYVVVTGALIFVKTFEVLDESVFDVKFGTTAPATTGNLSSSTVGTVTTVSGLAANVITAAATASDFGTEVAAAVLAAATATPIAADVQAVNAIAIVGSGAVGDEWGPV